MIIRVDLSPLKKKKPHNRKCLQKSNVFDSCFIHTDNQSLLANINIKVLLHKMDYVEERTM